MTADLAWFLLDRISEDEEEARYWTCDCAMEGFPLRHGLRCEERVKAECDAKRRIVQSLRSGDPGNQWAKEAWCQAEDDVLRLLALPYADHPDYDEAWRPA